MSRLPISVERYKELRHKMRKLKIFEKDIKESFSRSSGAGGQNVNKVSTCVTLLHGPSAIQIKCQESRTQGANRYKARLLLIKKIEHIRHLEQLAEVQKREKVRRQNRKKPKHLKEKILKEKHMKADKKKQRKNVNIAKGWDHL